MIELTTCSVDGWPHVAQLSVGEIQLGEDGLIRLALWAGSQSTEALATSMVAVLLFVDVGSIFEVRCRLVSSAKLHTETPLAGFLLAPVAVRDKNAPYATIVSGSRFALLDPEATAVKWAVAQSALYAQFPLFADVAEASQ